MTTLLLVEDDEAIALPLAEGLHRAGFAVTRAATGEAALAAEPADLVLLDLGLPDMDGIEVCRKLRSRSEVPIIVVTARSDEVDRVVGLEVGADDYVVKPFGLRELVARIRAVLRRAPGAGGAREDATTFGVLVVDRRSRRVTVRGGEVALTPKEFEVLSLLADDPGAVVRRGRLFDEIWDRNWYGPTKTLDVHVASLRRKLGDARFVETVRGVGFRLAKPT